MAHVTRSRARPSVLSEVGDQQVPVLVRVNAGLMSARGLEAPKTAETPARGQVAKPTSCEQPRSTQKGGWATAHSVPEGTRRGPLVDAGSPQEHMLCL